MNAQITEETLIHDFILENELTTEEGLACAEAVGGYNVETLNHIIYFKTGMHDVQQCWECAKDEFVFNDEIIKEFNLK